MAHNPEATVYIGNLDPTASERVLYEILVQAGPLVSLHIPKDKTTQRQCTYGFAEYVDKQSASYAIKLFSGLVRLHNRLLVFNTTSSVQHAEQKHHPDVNHARNHSFDIHQPNGNHVQEQVFPRLNQQSNGYHECHGNGVQEHVFPHQQPNGNYGYHGNGYQGQVFPQNQMFYHSQQATEWCYYERSSFPEQVPPLPPEPYPEMVPPPPPPPPEPYPELPPPPPEEPPTMDPIPLPPGPSPPGDPYVVPEDSVAPPSYPTMVASSKASR